MRIGFRANIHTPTTFAWDWAREQKLKASDCWQWSILMGQSGLGLFLLFVAGAMNGSFTLPMKFTRKWAWENTWLAWTIFALAIFPLVLTLLTVPALGQVYAQTGPGPALLAAAFGAGWGVSQVFLGLAVDGIGMALSFSVILGISAALGSIVPLVRLHPEAMFQKGGITVLGGIALVLLGVGIAAIAGRRRELALAANSVPTGGRASSDRSRDASARGDEIAPG